MGEVFKLADYRSRRAERDRSREPARGAAQTEFYFDLASPFTYLAAERVERSFADVLWIPAAESLVRMGPVDIAAEHDAATARAAAVRLPLVWGERWPDPVPGAMRAAGFAAEQGRGAAFVLAACRLVWAGGFDIEDPDVLAEAAAAANLPFDATLEAFRDASRDAGSTQAARRVRGLGADRLPALVVGRTVFAGEERMAEAAALARGDTAAGA
jgi:2-hydroxychromene-2-carboxylate isomerase